MDHESKRVCKFRFHLTLLLGLAGVVTQSGCEGKSSTDQNTLRISAEKLALAIPDGTVLNLTLAGYNYTSRYIDDFSVNGQGGGNIYVSSESSSGGGNTCCVRYVKGARARVVNVRWQSGGCMYRYPGKLASGRTHLVHGFYREAEVQVNPLIPERPAYFEVHFYPDGHVEAAITERASNPRLSFSKQREDSSEFPRCPNDKQPSQG